MSDDMKDTYELLQSTMPTTMIDFMDGQYAKSEIEDHKADHKTNPGLTDLSKLSNAAGMPALLISQFLGPAGDIKSSYLKSLSENSDGI
jgi:hypothetical protein